MAGSKSGHRQRLPRQVLPPAELDERQTLEADAVVAEARFDLERRYMREARKFPLLKAGEELSLAFQMGSARSGINRLYHLHARLALPATPPGPGSRSLEDFPELVERFWSGVSKAADEARGLLNRAGKDKASRARARRDICQQYGVSSTTLLELQNVLAALRDECKAHRHRLIASNLRLVPYIARKYKDHGLALTDLIQEGNLGLMKAVDRFDPSLGYKFSTYAYWWIKQSIERAIADTARIIRLPVHVHERVRQVRAVYNRLYQKLGRKPTPEDISVEVKKLSPKAVEYCLNLVGDPLSLDQPMLSDGHDDPRDLKEAVPDDEAVLPDEQCLLNERSNAVHQALAGLSEMQAKIVRMRFGIGYEREHTLEEVGKVFNLTRERIRQIEARALLRLSTPKFARHLRPLVQKTNGRRS